MDKITDYLYISGYGCVTQENLAKRQISYIIDATNLGYRPMKGIETMKVDVDDMEHSQICKFFDKVSDKIKENKEKNRITLVHCMAGISRSPTLCMAYFVKHENHTLEESYKKIFECRSIISPNSGFWKQMIQYEKKIRNGQSSVKMVARTFDEVPDLYLKNNNYSQL